MPKTRYYKYMTRDENDASQPVTLMFELESGHWSLTVNASGDIGNDTVRVYEAMVVVGNGRPKNTPVTPELLRQLNRCTEAEARERAPQLFHEDILYSMALWRS